MTTISEALTRIETITRNDVDAVREFGPLEIGPTGRSVEDLLCVDGTTRVAASPQVREFYAYALWWTFSSVELEWLDPGDLAGIMERPRIEEMLRKDTRDGTVALAGMNEGNTVLFSVDDVDAPFDRAYFVFLDDPEPAVVYAGSEVSVHRDLLEYLEGWITTLGE